jgi:hypothetical protein
MSKIKFENKTNMWQQNILYQQHNKYSYTDHFKKTCINNVGITKKDSQPTVIHSLGFLL